MTPVLSGDETFLYFKNAGCSSEIPNAIKIYQYSVRRKPSRRGDQRRTVRIDVYNITRGLVNWPLWTGYSGSLGSALVAFVKRLKRVNVWTVRRDEEEWPL